MALFNSLRRILPPLVTLGALTVGGQMPVDAQQPTFKSGIAMVPLTVTVTDTTGRFVTGLSRQDFTVLEDGVEQPLAFFARDDVPVDLALVLDVSGSMRSDLPLVQSAAAGLVRTLRPADRSAVVHVNDSARIPQPFTSDRTLVERAIGAVSISGSTALYDGMYIVLREFERERRQTVDLRRQVLVLLSDGQDNRSRLEFEDVSDLARRVGVSIYIIALRGPLALKPRAQLDGPTLRAEYTMGAVARDSGGRIFFPKSSRELRGIYTAIAEELASQYELGYMPVKAGGAGGFRRVAVRVPPQANALARTRSGYYVPRSTAARY